MSDRASQRLSKAVGACGESGSGPGAAAEGRHGGQRPVISKDMMRIALGRRADGESAASIAKGLTYKTASGDERTVSRRALYNAFKAHDADRTESA